MEGGTDGCEGGGGGESRGIGLQWRRTGIRQVLACWCYVLPSDSDCVKESSEWTATAVLWCVVQLCADSV